MDIDLTAIVEGQKSLKAVTDELKKSIDQINQKYETNMVEIVKILDANQKNHAQAVSDVHKVIESILNRK